MNFKGIDFWLLVLSIFLITSILIYLLRKRDKSQLRTVFILDILLTLIISLGVLIQSLCVNIFNADPLIFENFIYIGTCFLPVSIYFTSLLFVNTKIRFKKKHLLLMVVPVISLIVLWTNNYHHLFYVNYSASFTETIFGPYMYIHTIYTYLLLFTGIIRLLHFSIKNSGFFSRQSLLFVFSILSPIIVNVLGGVLKVIPMTVFATPIAFAFSIICLALAIFKFGFLQVTPIALQRIVDRISDGYIILDENNVITDFNQTFLKMFDLETDLIRGKKIYNILSQKMYFNMNLDNFNQYINTAKNSNETIKLQKKLINKDRYFNIEINNIKNGNNFLGIIILFKDVTQHVLDMNTIQNNQDMLMEKERLASLGQLIGGISHNLKTPIMSISGAAEGLTDLINEYDASIGDSDVTDEDHHAIANDMKEWITKLHSYAEYMSDIITAVKGQAVKLSENEKNEFSIEELFKRVNILMKHEIKKASLTLDLKLEISSSTTLHGDVNSLVQVINNLITNAIQSYNGKTGEIISLIAKKKDNNLIISVSDNGCGMPKDVQEKLFKTMITTKGKNGTGLGMFMSYSTIKGHFNGDITFKSEINEGTTFNIILPLSVN